VRSGPDARNLDAAIGKNATTGFLKPWQACQRKAYSSLPIKSAGGSCFLALHENKLKLSISIINVLIVFGN
jgi:hypothetical protein